MKTLNIVIVFLLCSWNMFGQQPTLNLVEKVKVQPPDYAAQFAETISSEDLSKHLHILASDEFEGRETGEPGNKKAAEYIAEQFQSFGLPGISENKDYFQKVSFSWTSWSEIVMHVKGERFKHLWNFLSFPTQNDNIPLTETNEVIMLGYGIDDEKYSDYKNVDVKGKVVIVYKGEPKDENGVSFLTGTTEESAWSQNLATKLVAAKKHGVRTILIIEDRLQEELGKYRHYLMGPRITLGEEAAVYKEFANNALVSTNIAKALIGKRLKKVVKAREKYWKKGKPKAVKLKTKFSFKQSKSEKTLAGENVLGYIEGTDPELKHELVVITAHYDHLGKRGDGIYNGADDNGSGTSTAIEVAQALAEAKAAGQGTRRSVLVMLVTGEEKGLLGSQYYTEFPTFPLENTIANINIDMVGRVDEKYKDNPDYIYVIGSDRLSTELHEINEAANKEYTNLVLDYTYNAEDDPNRYYYRSDHYNFAEKGIPAIFYFNGTHPDYHLTSDTVEKINFDKMEKIGKLVFHTAWKLANRDKRIIVDVPQKK